MDFPGCEKVVKTIYLPSLHVHVWCLGVVFILYIVSTCFQSLFAIHFDYQTHARLAQDMVAERHA